MIPIKLLTLVALPMVIGSTPSSAAETTETTEKSATRTAKSAKAPAATKFIRVLRDDQKVRLQTGITTYVKNGVSVDLIGAIHIADADYYT
ncbi:MAG: hypothetical protein KJO79_00560, partial [Verrucomicrobiae bacterium]|nr:hypothetical protein [Verrucomicrobiae bacterium]